MTKTPRTIVVPGVFCICVSWLGRFRLLPFSSCGSSPALWQGSVHTGPGLRDLRRWHPHTSSGKSCIHRLPGAIRLRQFTPLRTSQSIPLSMFRSSFRGRPRFPALSAGSSFFTRSHCSFVNSYRFMTLFSHLYLICAILIFQTSPNLRLKEIV